MEALVPVEAEARVLITITQDGVREWVERLVG